MIDRKIGLIGSGLVAITLALGGCGSAPKVRYPIRESVGATVQACTEIRPRYECPERTYPVVVVYFK